MERRPPLVKVAPAKASHPTGASSVAPGVISTSKSAKAHPFQAQPLGEAPALDIAFEAAGKPVGDAVGEDALVDSLAMVLDLPGEGPSGSFEAKLLSRYFLGPSVEYFLDVAGTELRVQCFPVRVEPGGNIFARIALGHSQIVAY